MASLTDFGENLVLNWLMTGSAQTRPTEWTVGLYTSPPGEAGGGTEVSGGNYSRQAVSFSNSLSPAGFMQNSSNVAFTAVGGDFGLVTHAAIFMQGGEMLWYGSVTNPREYLDGDTLVFQTGDIAITLD